MSLLAPAALALAGLAVPIIAMYVLWIRRQDRMVSSTLLWRQVLDDARINSSWRRFRPNVLLLVQLLVLACLVLVLARPAYSHAGSVDGDLVLIVDESYGMQAHDVLPSRFSEALARAHHLASDVGKGSVVSVIGMSAEPRLAIADSDDGSAVAQGIDGLHAGVAPANFPAALSLAATLATTGKNTHVVVLTSRDSGITGLPFHVSLPVEIERIGKDLRDLGITTFGAADVDGRTRAVLRVRNFGSYTASSDLDLYVDGQLADLRPLTVPPGGEKTEVWSYLPERSQRLEARLTRSDDMPGDKTAFAVAHAGSVQHVLLVSRGNYFLQTALALDSSIALTVLPPKDYRLSAARRADLVVFDAVVPRALPPTSVLLVGPHRGRSGPISFAEQRAIHALQLTPSASGSLAALLRDVDLGDVHVSRARRFRGPDWLQTVIGAGGVPLIAAGDAGGRRLAVLTFNLEESDWPLRVSFPILVHNLVHYLAPGLVLGAGSLQAGEQITMHPSPGTRQIQIERPDGRVDRLYPPYPPFRDTAEPGFYRARQIGSTRAAVAFAVNTVPPRPHPAPGPDVLQFGQPHASSEHRAGVQVTIDRAFGLLALALLAFEWWLGFRR